MSKKRGFTLVELLAVIVILAVILVIAVPQIMSVIESSKKGSIESTAKLIVSTAEREYTNKKILGESTDNIKCNDVASLNNNDYGTCSILFDSVGKATVTITGKGKFEGYTCKGNSTNMECTKNENVSEYKKATEYIKELYDDTSTRTENGLKKDNTSDENIRYEGSNPNNYVKFNDELWRIIGVFGDNVKLIRSENIGALVWDSSDETINKGRGVNEWSRANLKEFLNTMYYGGTDIVCYGGREQDEGDCPTEKLNDTAKSMIDNYTWNTGAVDNTKTSDTTTFYNAERGFAIGKDSGDDDIERTTTWTGYVALPYVTDWAYASSTDGCDTNMQQKDSNYNYVCKNNNWMTYGDATSDAIWMLSPFATSGEPYYVWNVIYTGGMGAEYVFAPRTVFPTIYLNSDVKITGGTGTSTDPYILSN